MITNIILSVIFLFLLGLVIIHSRYAKAGIGEKPIIYQSVLIQFFLNVALLIFLGFSVYLLFFHSWKSFLILLAVGAVTEGWLFVPLIEKMIYAFADRIISKVEKQNNVKDARFE